MHPISRRSITYLVLLFIISIPIIIISLIESVFLIAVLLIPILIDEPRFKFTHKFFAGIILIVICYPLFLIGNYLFHKVVEPRASSLISIGVVILVTLLLRSLILKIIKRIDEAATLEDRFHTTIKYYPKLICELHDTKPALKTYFGYKQIVCKDGDENCLLDNKIRHARNVIGLIGGYTKSVNIDGDYYLRLWDEEQNKVKVTDCNIIEIHESDKIKDYDAVISKVIQLIYNEVGRTKPINEVPVRIIGNPKIKDSTRHLMKERFLEVEPAESEYLRYC